MKTQEAYRLRHILSMACPAGWGVGGGYPCPGANWGSGGEGRRYPVLVLAGGRGGRYPILILVRGILMCWSWLRGILLSWSWLRGTTVLGSDWSTPSLLPLCQKGPGNRGWKGIWYQRLGYTPRKDLGPQAGKGPGIRGWDTPERTWDHRPGRDLGPEAGVPLPLNRHTPVKT